MKREENLKYQKLYSTPPWHGAHTCKVSRKYINAFFSYSAKTKRDGQTDRQTDIQMDRQTDGPGALQYLPSRAFGAAGDKNWYIDILYVSTPQRVVQLWLWVNTGGFHIWTSEDYRSNFCSGAENPYLNLNEYPIPIYHKISTTQSHISVT